MSSAPVFGDAAAIKAARKRPCRGPVWATRYGAGPVDETCATCVHLLRRDFAKRYYKCGLRDTASDATDIRKKDPACLRWGSRDPVACMERFAAMVEADPRR